MNTQTKSFGARRAVVAVLVAANLITAGLMVRAAAAQGGGLEEDAACLRPGCKCLGPVCSGVGNVKPCMSQSECQ